MGNWFYDNEFEDLLKNQANQHRMYPSDQTWRNIQHEVHGYKRWPALTVFSIFIIAALVVGTVIVKPHNQVLDNKNDQFAINKKPSPKESEIAANGTESEKNYADHFTIETITKQTIAKANETVLHNNTEEEIFIVPPIENNIPKKIDDNNETKTQIASNIPEPNNKPQNNKKEPAVNATSLDSYLALNAALRSNLIPKAGSRLSTELYSDEGNGFKNYFAVFTLQPSLSNTANSEYNFDFDLTKDNTQNTVSSPLSRIGGFGSKLDFQFYLTPSISYRRLHDNVNGQLSKSYVTAIPYESNYVVDLNHVVQHRPAVGYEVGFSLGYNLNKNLAIRSGFQFNIRQYNIDAYVHTAEPASIALSRDNSNSFINTVTGFRNVQGSEPIELKNRYYEISLPIGIDWRPVNGKFVWGVSTSVQPTYTFDKEPFIITSNFKNYADGSQLMRNWNINANIETYVGYNTGKYRWQLGPQLRYQLLPTMSTSYPIREYPVDFGLKLSLIRALK